MSDENPTNAAVLRGILTNKPPVEALPVAQGICTAGAQSATVQGSLVAKSALDELNASVETAQQWLTKKNELANALRAATSALDVSMADVKAKLRTYEGAVGAIARRNSAVITEAGLLSRPVKAPAAALEPVSKVNFRRGKLTRQGVVSWPEAPGAGSYLLAVNFDTTAPDGPYETLGAAASSRRRVVTAPAPGAQFYAKVAAVGHDSTMSAWTAAVLVTAR